MAKVINLVHYTLTPKYRRSVFDDRFVSLIVQGNITRIANRWNCTLHAVAVQPDHVHVMVELHPSISVAFFAQQIKRVSSWRLRQLRPDLISSTAFWGRSYYARSVGGDAKAVKKYVDDQVRKYEAN